jgi:putative zinc finger/helix-turn-helix YgiT family protein
MKIIKSEEKLCLICMEHHLVHTVIMEDTELYKDERVTFNATYEYCEHADELLEDEEMIKANSLAMKDAYRKKLNLLTSKDIKLIRRKYGVSQKDFSEILGWGKATITRYENHQVQDQAHEDVLRKIDSDPKWFLQMLDRAKGRISNKAYEKYKSAAKLEFRKMKNSYLIDSIYAIYATFSNDSITGGVQLDLNKVIEVINYYALNVSNLHKVKLMKMLWSGDCLSFKRRGKPITGLVYRALPMGAVPEGHHQIIELDGVEYDEVIYKDDYLGYKFYPVDGFEVKLLTEDEIRILDDIIKEVGELNANEIVKRMHDEIAYECTERLSPIPFKFAESISII